jgi:phage shock protein E
MKKWTLANKWILLGASIGAIGGYAYYHYVGCTSGTCMITSKPVNSTVYFAVMGALFFSLFNKKTDGSTKQP